MGWIDKTRQTVRGWMPKWAQKKEKRWEPELTWEAMKWFGAAVLIVVVVAGWRPLERHLSGQVGQKRAGVLGWEKVELVDAPTWMPGAFRQRMSKLVADRISTDPLDSRGPLLAVRALYQSGWVEEVKKVQRVAGGVKVEAVFRQPAAFVQEKQGYRLVDGKSVRLPGMYSGQQVGMLKLPVIVGVSKVAGRDGEVWPGEEVVAGLALVKVLGRETYFRQVKAVDVSGRDELGRLRLGLRTERGLVLWGLPPGKEEHVEPPMEVKKQMIGEVYRRKGSIDAGGATVEVYGAAPFIREPAVALLQEG